MDETLRFLRSVTLTDEKLGIAANAMEYLTAVIGAATGLVEDDPVHCPEGVSSRPGAVMQNARIPSPSI